MRSFRSLLKITLGLAFVMAMGVSCTSCDNQPDTTTTPPPPTDNGGFDGSDIGEDSGPPEVPIAGLDAVYFDYDQSAIRDDQRSTLRSNADVIRSGSWSTIVIEGHCDERGSEEYNLALGERRANAVKRYLTDSGISAGRLDTVSFGEARPAVRGRDESAWASNRRAEFRGVE